MSYLEFYNKNVHRHTGTIKGSTAPQDVRSAATYVNENKATSDESSETTEFIRGTCFSMCPEDEVLMREKAKMVHILEVIDGKKVLVKCYSRPAADSTVAVPRLLRPYIVLMNTVQHLLLHVVQREDTSATVIYDFVSDRLRAVRQDMTVQRLSAMDCIMLLEPMIRFHVYFGYKLCEYPINVYDPVLNKKLLLECLKWFLSCCDSIDQSSPLDDLDLDISLLSLNQSIGSDKIQSKKVLRDDKECTKCDRTVMECLYILCNLDDVHPMYRYWNLPEILKSHASIMLAYKIAVANWRGNYIQVCRQLENLCPLTYCALCVYLPTLQRRALLVMSAAYSSKQLVVPLRVLRAWLRARSDVEAKQLCAHYGLRAQGDAVRFARGDFKADVATHQPLKLIHMDQKMDLSAKHVFTYLSKDYTYGV